MQARDQIDVVELVPAQPARHLAKHDVACPVLPEGRYFKNPYSWDWEIRKITDIPAGKLGVLTRLYGSDLPPGSRLT